MPIDWVQVEQPRMCRPPKTEDCIEPVTATGKRTFASGATRNPSDGKPDYEGYLSPLVLEAFAQYMLKHSKMEDGSYRASDNWQKGIPQSEYMKSMFRHFMSVWKNHREGKIEHEDLFGLLFNVMGLIHETLKGLRE